jgi:hypothetical protein
MRKLAIEVMAVLCVLGAGAVWAADKALVPQTGQVLCYDSDGREIFCRGTGQDGALQEGVEIPTPRYTDKGNGTLKDNLTGLIWLKNANCPKGTRDWQTALNDVASLNSTGKMNGHDCGDTSGKKGRHNTDWCLPNIRELFSLVDFAFYEPAISNAAGTAGGSSNDPFTDFQFIYWSSTTGAISPDNAFEVNFVIGEVGFGFKGNRGFLYVIAVRGGS